MTFTQLKSSLHKLIDKSEDEDLLSVIHELMKQREKVLPGDLWNSLTDDQKMELLESEKGSNDPKNLIDHKDVMKNL